MEKITERENIKKAIASGLVDFRGEEKWRKKLFNALSALDPETCAVAQVDKAMNGRWWLRCYCDECNKDVGEIVKFGEDDPYGECNSVKFICKDCLRKALEL